MSYSAVSLKIESGKTPTIKIKNKVSGQTVKSLQTTQGKLEIDYMKTVDYLKSLGFIYLNEIDLYVRKES